MTVTTNGNYDTKNDLAYKTPVCLVEMSDLISSNVDNFQICAEEGTYSSVYVRAAETQYTGSNYTDTGDHFTSTFQDTFSIVAEIKPTPGQNTFRNCICGVGFDETNYDSRISIRYASNKFRDYYDVHAATQSRYVEVWSSEAHSIEDGEYHTIAVVLDNTSEEIRAYLDCEYITNTYEATYRFFSQTSVDMSNFNDTGDTKNLLIGAENHQGTPIYHFTGYIKNFNIYTGMRYIGE